MTTIGPAPLFPQIEEDLAAVGDEIARAMEAHPALEKSDMDHIPLLAATFLLFVRSDEHQLPAARSVATALELLELAVMKHYPFRFTFRGEIPKEFSSSLALITGDYFYARALQAVAGLKDVLVIRILATAISRVAEGIAEPISRPDSEDELVSALESAIDRMMSLYDAAASLAAHLLESSEPERVAFSGFAQSIGGLLYVQSFLSADDVGDTVIDALRKRFEERLSRAAERLGAHGIHVDLHPLTHGET